MKTFRIMAITVVFLVCMTALGRAQLITITFDEPGISIGSIITNQYQDLGITWSDVYSNIITTGSAFENAFESDGQIIQYDTKPAHGLIQLDSLAKNLSFEFRRPSASADIYLKLYDTTIGPEPQIVHDFGRIGWDGPDWVTFTYNGSYGNFDQIDITCSNKFVMDNLKIDFDKDNDGFTESEGDCNDNNSAIHPGAIEIRDGIDNNCDGTVCFISSLR